MRLRRDESRGKKDDHEREEAPCAKSQEAGEKKFGRKKEEVLGQQVVGEEVRGKEPFR
jgi:hypothetical protein